jgi:hypothetical protein
MGRWEKDIAREKDMVREKYEGDRCNAVGCGGIRVEDTIGQGRTSKSPSPLMVRTCSFCGDHAGERRKETSSGVERMV